MSRVSKAPVLTAILALPFIIVIINQLRLSPSLGYHDWGMTEWLINYAGGFVRRGLPGEAAARLAALTGVQANYLVIAISFAAFIALLALFLRLSRGKLPAYLIISSVVLGSPAYETDIIRKDVLGILLLVVCLAALKHIRSTVASFAVVNVAATLAMLSHETFFFFAVPAIVLAAAQRMNETSEGKTLAISIASLLPVLAVFVVTAIYHGSPAIAQAINASWSGLWTQVQPDTCCFTTPSNAIDAVQWGAGLAISFPIRTLTQFSHGIYVPLAWLVSILLCAWFMIGFVEDDGARRRMATTLVFQFVAIAPLYVLGWDFGRWIFFWTASSLAVFLFEIDIGATVFGRIVAKPAALLDRIATKLRPNPWLLLIFGVPSCCWSTEVYVNSAPFGPYYRIAALAFG